MIEKSFRYSKNENEWEKKSQEGNNVIRYVIVALATIALVVILVSASNTILRNTALNASNPSLASISTCKANALEYEQRGYYTGGVAQFNAVIDACV
jgi:hypothetical protein